MIELSLADGGTLERCLRSHLQHDPALALELLPSIPCSDQRRRLATVLAQSWARQDINAAWNAVARSPLSAVEKQHLFNELWG